MTAGEGVNEEAVELVAQALHGMTRPSWNWMHEAHEREREFFRAEARRVLAAAWPHVVTQVRGLVAGEIEAEREKRFAEYGNEETGPRNYDWALTDAARIARGSEAS